MSFIINSHRFGVPFSPSDVAGLEVWFKADAIVGLSDGDPVSTWEDSGSNNFDATSASTARPTYQTNELNGIPVVRFDGSDDFLSAAGVSVAQPDTIFLVAKRSAGVVNVYFDGAISRQAFFSLNDMINGIVLFAGSSVSSGDDDGTGWHYHSMIYNGASSEVWMDAVSIATGNPGTNALTSLNIGVDNTSAANFFTGDIAELIIYNGGLGTTDRQNVEAYLADKYAL